MFTSLDFFAGSGLVSHGLSPHFQTLWANDNCSKKQAVFRANHTAAKLASFSIEEVRGATLPQADLAWASFPCQDLSLAGKLHGLKHGTRSGLFWQWLRVLREMSSSGNRPSVLVAENVIGFLVADAGRHFAEAYHALRALGYRLGALVVDAGDFLPQSRRRAFLIASADDLPLNGLVQAGPGSHFHPEVLTRAAAHINDPDWLWWSIPHLTTSRAKFDDLCEKDAPYDSPSKTAQLCGMLSPLNQRRLDAAKRSRGFLAGTAYRRTRPGVEGTKVQRLELRFDGTAGCLRTPNGGSSRQTVLIVEDGVVHSRLMTVRECSRLMGAPDDYQLPGSYNDAYRAMGDAVAVPVTQWLTKHLLRPLAERGHGKFRQVPIAVCDGAPLHGQAPCDLYPWA